MKNYELLINRESFTEMEFEEIYDKDRMCPCLTKCCCFKVFVILIIITGSLFGIFSFLLMHDAFTDTKCWPQDGTVYCDISLEVAFIVPE